MRTNGLLSPGLLKNGLRRFWPLWLVGFIALFLTVDVPIYGAVHDIVNSYDPSDYPVAIGGVWSIMSLCSWAYALIGSAIVAIALNEHLFESRAATFVGSLPLRRHTVFATHYATGLLMLLVLPALAALCLLPLHVSYGGLITLAAVGRWYVVTAALAFVFHAIATLACQLSGARPVAVLLYGVMCFLAGCLEVAAQTCISALTYGLVMSTSYVDWLAPGIRLAGAAVDVDSPMWVTIAAYVAAAIAVSALSSVLYARRNLEAAGDSVAVPAIRPVLKYLMGVSMGLLFGIALCTLQFSDAIYGAAVDLQGAALLALMLAVGGFLGLLFAEIIMSRSTHVVSRCWRGGIVLAVVSLVFVGVCWSDVLGVVHRVPAPDDAESAMINSDYDDQCVMTSSDGRTDVTDLHRDLIAHGGVGESSGEYFTINISYQLKGGKTMVRSYRLPANYYEHYVEGAPADAATELIDRYVLIADSDEGRASRYADVLDKSHDEYSFQLEYRANEDTYTTIKLTDAERIDLIEHALRDDLMEEAAGSVLSNFGVWSETSYDAYLQVLYEQENELLSYDVYSVYLDEATTPHLVAWFGEHHPEIKLLSW